MKHKSQEKLEIRKKMVDLLSRTMVVDFDRARPGGIWVTTFFRKVQSINSRIKNISELLSYCFDIANSTALPTTALAIRRLIERYREHRQALHSADASHYEKRAFVHDLGLRRSPVEIIVPHMTSTDGAFVVHHSMQVRVIWRQRESQNTVRQRSVLADTQSRSNSLDFIVNSTTGFLEVGEDESVVVLSATSDRDGEMCGFEIELVVLRGIFLDSSHGGSIYSWASEVIVTACAERRNVRPTHEGLMVQLGWNAGPRHANVWGLAKSYTKPLGEDVKAQHDEDAIALLTLCWSIAKATLPVQIIRGIDAALENNGLPRIATRSIAPGRGYQLKLGDKIYSFPDFERAPPEGYFSQDYVAWSHIDPCYARWGISWCIDRTLDSKINSEVRYKTRSRQKVDMPDLWPKRGGGNFVDITLRVVVKQAKGTLMAFQPEYAHGTTRLCGAHNRMCTITFSSHILDAFRVAQGGTRIDSGPGAGDGNDSDDAEG